MARQPIPQFGVVATRALADMVRNLASGLGRRFELRLIEKSAEEAIPVAREMAQAGLLDAVIAAGRGAEVLRAALDVPVTQIPVTGYDILRALAEARRHNPRAVLLTRRRLAGEFEVLKPLLNFELTPLLYDGDDDARRHLDTLSRAVRPVVVGSSQIVHLASQYDLPAVLIYSVESVMAAFESALELTRVASLEEAKRERLDRILESLSEGVAAVDLDERVQAINPALAGLVGVAAEWAVGRRLSELAPALSLAGVLKSGEPRRDEVVTVAGRKLVTQRLPLFEAGQQSGAVLTLQESAAIERADRKLRAEARKSPFRARYALADVLGESPLIEAARELATLYAGSDSSVLIEGESGTGKELFAQGIHQASRRAEGPFVALNCAAFPESLLESELFGYEEGAFTGSRRGGKPGLVELADRGTLFLDEIGDMPLPLQTRLLRVLQEREVLRLGAGEPIPVDVRVIAATHAELRAAVEAGRFRADLYYRLAILTLPLPALARRGGDVRLLALRLAGDALARLSAEVPAERLVAPLLSVADGYGWPGNVRELQNVVERLAVFLRAAGRLLDADVRRLAPELTGRAGGDDAALAATTEQVRRSHVEAVLAECGGDRTVAAERLGISRTTLWRLLRR
ncbi:propionate catabolism operon regulatory protein PrpR [Chitinimonas koreensis]|uniref:propionate catabolism operon regulatory protein PrpR n=1 Tax=Chitinimonas koreensis TaxID=356302 RepID=UPI0004234617|nr:propionate catabolism operon regulatory protein PrpR [Chitinimonas koreensis]QNM94978.1 propionate catabolism operon regulatory protein PrpR [Chitinimonas koreensis]